MIVLPVAGYFLFEGAAGDAARKIFLAGMRDNRTNALPFPPLAAALPPPPAGIALFLLRLLYYLPPAAYVFAGLWAMARIARGGREGWNVALVAFFGAAAFNQTVWRSDLAHLFQSLPPFYLLALWLTERSLRRIRHAAPALAAAAPVVAILVLQQYAAVWRSPGGAARLAAAGLQPLPPYYTGSVAQMGGETEVLPIPRAPVRVPPEQAAFLVAVGETLDEYSKPGDYIVTLPGLQMIYYLFHRRNPTGYIHLRRALDNPEEEERYIRDLTARPTRMVLVRDFAIDGREDRRLSRFAPRIVEAIENEFIEVRSLGNLKVYVRREGPREG